MKYIITESKLEETIMNYFDELFDIHNIHWSHPYEYDDETGEEGDDKNRILFYSEGDEDGERFRWYGCEYFSYGSPAKDICPTVSVEYPYVNSLNGYFGDMWQEPFKKWVKLHFDLPVKTVEWW